VEVIMSDLLKRLQSIVLRDEDLRRIEDEITAAGFTVVESNTTKPWGAYFRIDSSQADEFVEDFFPGLTPEEARLGIEGAELSPKILVVLPGQRLSWQYHDRRAERWRFLTSGGYRRSETNDENDRHEASINEVAQFVRGERHRLEGNPEGLVLVAEIWQHSDVSHPSDEDDIVRVSDDYIR
jgi:mannose-6-phosphate isomerase-like protein (cupin superfamily)